MRLSCVLCVCVCVCVCMYVCMYVCMSLLQLLELAAYLVLCTRQFVIHYYNNSPSFTGRLVESSITAIPTQDKLLTVSLFINCLGGVKAYHDYSPE